MQRKLILSRKGFDSGRGKVPSPILPTGQLCSLPIPEARQDKHGLCYGDIGLVLAGDLAGPPSGEPGFNPEADVRLGQLVTDLSQGQILPSRLAHLDPDLNPASRDRLPGWRPCFGQAGAAERHLQNQGVGPGDLFLFFGWFRQVERIQDPASPSGSFSGSFSGSPSGSPSGRASYRYVKAAPDLHVLFGWLQVAARIDPRQPSQVPPWLRQHPHAQGRPYAAADAIYIAREQLQLPGLPQLGALPGGGLFSQFHPALQLTAPGRRRSQWLLPGWFWPGGEATPPLSYHGRRDRWQRQGDRQLLQTVGRGQEFVLPLAEPHRAKAWLAALWEPMGTNCAQPISGHAISAKGLPEI